MVSIFSIIFFLSSLSLLLCTLHPFSQQIAKEILSKDELYLIYISPQPNLSILSIFSKYCQSKSNCTVLDSNNQAFQYFTGFVGYKQPSYFVIIDAVKHYKYVCPITEQFHINLLHYFQMQFLDNQLQPYFASEDQGERFDLQEKCMKLVGNNYEKFLVQDEPIKIVFLYAQQKFCQICQTLLQKFIKISDRYFQRGTIRFGFFDVIKNDNRLITDQLTPYVLIYINDNFEDPYGVGVQQFDDLPKYIKEIMKNTKKVESNNDL